MEQVSEYQQQAIDFANKYGVKLQILDNWYGRHFADDVNREIYKCKLSRGGKSYTFNFGQSINNAGVEPTLYDVFTCLQKYHVGKFEDFCSEFGYDDNKLSEYPKVMKIYKGVLREYNALLRLFPEDQESEVWQELQEIQ